MKGKLFSIFKTQFAVVMLAATITVFFVGCNPTSKKDTTDKGYTVPKETAEKQALIDDWLTNKTVKIEADIMEDGSADAMFILYNNMLYRKSSAEINRGSFITVQKGNETEIYSAAYDLTNYDVYDWDGQIVAVEDKYLKIIDFNTELNDDCDAIQMSRLFNKYFTHKGNGVYGIKRDNDKLRELVADYFYIGYGLADIEELNEGEAAINGIKQYYQFAEAEFENFEELKKFCWEFFGGEINKWSEEDKNYIYNNVLVEFKQNEFIVNIGHYATKFTLFDGEIIEHLPQ